MRGRNRRGPNPLTRSYESNGPDVKIRGTAAHVAEKYVQLARDAHASGDPVAAESYLQHAEHYLRLIAAAQTQQFAAQQAAMGGAPVDPDEAFGDDDEFESSVMDRFTFRAPQAPTPPGYSGENGNGEQPRHEYQPRGDQPRHERQDRENPSRNDQPRQDRENRGEFRRDRDFRRERFERNQQRFDRQQQPDVAAAESDAGLPSFITAPVRIPIEAGAVPGSGDQPDIGAPSAMAGEEGEGRFPLRPRRRRNRRGPRDDMGAGENGDFGDSNGDTPAGQPENAPTE